MIQKIVCICCSNVFEIYFVEIYHVIGRIKTKKKIEIIYDDGVKMA